MLIILNLNKDADRPVSFYHLNKRNRAKAVKSHNSDGDVRTHIIYIENLHQGEMLKNLGGKKVTAKDMKLRKIWGLSCILVVFDHISSSSLLFTKPIQIMVRKFRRGKFNDQEQARIRLLFSTKHSMHMSLLSKTQNKTSRVYANGCMRWITFLSLFSQGWH